MSEKIAINLREERDVGAVLNVTFEFVKGHIVPFGKALLFIIGPVSLLLGVVLTNFSMMDTTLETSEEIDALLSYGWQLALLVLFMIVLQPVVATLSIAAVNAYMILSSDSTSRPIEVADVWEIVRNQFWRMMRTVLAVSFMLAILFVVAMMVAGITIGVPLGLLGSLAGGGDAVAGVFGVLGVIFGMFIGFGIMVFFSVILSIVFPMRMHEPVGLNEAVRKAYRLVKKHWWSTFLVIVVAYVIMYILGLVFSIPQFILTALSEFNMLGYTDQPWYIYPLILLSIVGTLGSTLLAAIPQVAIAFQYFSLTEQTEKTGLKQRIDELKTGRASI